MRKLTLNLIICIFVSLCFISCGRREENIGVRKIESIVTEKYDINDLNAYFAGRNANESCLTATFENTDYDDVNRRFPIEVIRPEGYSVYSVKQGGYYYVFWSRINMSSQELIDENPCVYFTAYLNSIKDVTIF